MKVAAVVLNFNPETLALKSFEDVACVVVWLLATYSSLVYAYECICFANIVHSALINRDVLDNQLQTTSFLGQHVR